MEQLEQLWHCVKNADENHLTKLLELHPDKPWDWPQLSRNPNIGLEFILDNIDKDWDWYWISMDKRVLNSTNLGEALISSKIQKKIKWNMLSKNRNLTWDIVSKNLHQDWDWVSLSTHLKVTPEIIENNPQIPWDWYFLSDNPSITCDFVEKNIHKHWDWSGLSGNPNIGLEFIETHPEIPWSWYWLSCNSNVTWEFVSRHLDKPWYWPFLAQTLNAPLMMLENSAISQNWEWLSENIRSQDISWVTWELVKKNIHRGWNWYWVSANITCEIVEKNIHQKWDWQDLSRNPNISLEFIEKNLTKPWDWCYLSKNTNIVCEFISNERLYADMSKFWVWHLVSANKYITWDFVKKNPQMPWDWNVLSENPNFGLDFARDSAHIRDISQMNYERFSKNPNLTCEFITNNIHQDWNWDLLSQNLFNKHPEVKACNKKLKAQYYHLALELFLGHIFPNEIILHIIRYV